MQRTDPFSFGPHVHYEHLKGLERAVSIEAEWIVLSAPIGSLDRFHAVNEKIQDHMFYEPLHQAMWRRIARMASQGKTPTLRAIDNVMKLDPDYAEVSKAHDGCYMRHVIDFGALHFEMVGADHSGLMGYAQVVVDNYFHREVMIASHEIGRMCMSEDAHGQELMDKLESVVMTARMGTTTKRERFTSMHEGAGLVYQHLTDSKVRPMLTTGLQKLDRITGGHERGELVVIAGRPGMGKSALASCIALSSARQGQGNVEINGEMTVAQMSRRHVSDFLEEMHGADGPTYQSIRARKLRTDQTAMVQSAQEHMGHLPLLMMKRTGMTIQAIRSVLRRQKAEWAARGIDMANVFIDHVGLIRSPGARSRVEEQTNISMELKELAEEMNVVMYGLAQLNRQVESRDDKRPTLPDLRDSGSWEQDADVVIGVYRDAYYAQREKPGKKADIVEIDIRRADPTVEAILLKAREGPLGTAELWSDIGRNAIRDEAGQRRIRLEL
ncbi:replicative DNA helicase [Tetraselmis viridis virus SI1]|uniref:DnaB-like replicative helicase n=1 Tax=Tetraselmis viridis virus S20 TaxID=754070 RepID=UPI0002C07357|nr:DnaB-like replicative helicase [Tetraselmis viridis virus S20]AGH31333.1 replicative DNA helicase [Tetraselmis viridis virus S20]AGH31421.1 replicative DNA helicase [Tetraselmis viridis virus SI1]